MLKPLNHRTSLKHDVFDSLTTFIMNKWKHMGLEITHVSYPWTPRALKDPCTRVKCVWEKDSWPGSTQDHSLAPDFKYVISLCWDSRGSYKEGRENLRATWVENTVKEIQTMQRKLHNVVQGCALTEHSSGTMLSPRIQTLRSALDGLNQTHR